MNLVPANAGTAISIALPIVVAYVMLTSLGLVLSWTRRLPPSEQLSVAITADLIFVIALVTFTGGIGGNYTMLYFLPVAGAALLSSRAAALLVASTSTVAILADAGIRHVFVRDFDSAFFQAGTLGAAMLGVSIALHDLARRVNQQERMVTAKNAELRAQIETNRLVIRDMPQGVLVVSSRGEVRAANPSARTMLGANKAAGEDQFDRWMREYQPSLVALLSDWARTPTGEPRVQDLVIDAAPVGRQIVSMNATMPLAQRPRMIRVRSIAALNIEREAPAVVYLEDLREVEAQAVQLKLASMGRLSASIAHEIRNPLAAIGHASALLSEELKEPAGARLIRIIDDNVQRLDRIVNDILAVSRSARANPERINLATALTSLIDEFSRAHGVERSRITIDAPDIATIVFDRTHFTQIIDNLLSNAVRHASNQDGAIEVVVDAATTGDLSVSVIDDGPGVHESLRGQLFEPFFTTFRKGTGVGLYLARELAIANRSTLFLDDSGHATGACFTLRIAPLSAKPITTTTQ